MRHCLDDQAEREVVGRDHGFGGVRAGPEGVGVVFGEGHGDEVGPAAGALGFLQVAEEDFDFFGVALVGAQGGGPLGGDVGRALAFVVDGLGGGFGGGDELFAFAIGA